MTLAYFAKQAAAAQRMRTRMERSGFTPGGHRLWTPLEDELCHLLHSDQFALRHMLSHRSPSAIQARCRKLGFVRKRHEWGPLKKQKLRKIYPEATHEELYAAFPGVELVNIRAAANRYKYYRKKKPYKRTGIVANDQLRSYCYDSNMVMRELDEAGKTGRYFQTRGYRTKYPNFKAIYKAAGALGGVLRFHPFEEASDD
ncbi:hypothetical protein G6L05_02875 [Agrobacterium rhizogenes]|nr:hypothetical protein [Rhizobium rhizogenes]